MSEYIVTLADNGYIVESDDPEQYISERLDTIRELLDECDYQLMACSDINEGWETREED